MPHLSHDLFLAYPLSKHFSKWTPSLSSPLYSKVKCWVKLLPTHLLPFLPCLESSFHPLLFRCCIHVPIEKRQTSYLKTNKPTLNYFSVLFPKIRIFSYRAYSIVIKIGVFIMDKNTFSNPQFILKFHPGTSLVVQVHSALQCRGHWFDPWERRFHMWCGVTPPKRKVHPLSFSLRASQVAQW